MLIYVTYNSRSIMQLKFSHKTRKINKPLLQSNNLQTLTMRNKLFEKNLRPQAGFKITFSKLSQILPNCLEGKYGYHLGEFSNTSFVMFGAGRVQFKFDVLPYFRNPLLKKCQIANSFAMN